MNDRVNLNDKLVVRKFYGYFHDAVRRKLKKPMTWALYQTWRWAERIEDPDAKYDINSNKHTSKVKEKQKDDGPKDPYEKCKTCGMDRSVCTGCMEVLELEKQMRESKLFCKEDNCNG